MKKIVSILMVIIMILGVATVANATTSATLAEEIYKVGKPYGMTQANKVRIERYLSENKVSDEDAEKVLAKAKELAKLFDNADASKYSELSASEKDQVKTLCNEAAEILGLTLKFKASEVEIYKNGKLIEVARYDGSKLLFTGNNVNTILVVSSVVVIALVATFALRKKFANA